MTDKSLRLVEAVLSSCQSEEETAEDMALLRTILVLREEAEKRWIYVYGAAYNYSTNKGVEAQLQIRITKDKGDFLPTVEHEDTYILR